MQHDAAGMFEANLYAPGTFASDTLGFEIGQRRTDRDTKPEVN